VPKFEGELKMAPTFRSLLSIVAVLGSLTAITTLAFAHDPWWTRGPNDPIEAAEDWLSPEQIQELEQLRQSYWEQALPLERELESKWSELEDLNSRPGAELDQMLALRRQIRNLEGELDDLRYETSIRWNRMLPPEQRNSMGDTEDLLAGHGIWSCDAGCFRHGRSQRHRWHSSRNWDNPYDHKNHGDCC
jgi:Spy/CpxP family protein refolding chaperone